MATTTPQFTDNVSVVPAQLLAVGSGNVVKGTLDLRNKFGALLFLRVGRTGTDALSDGVSIQVRPTLNNDVIGHPVGISRLTSAAAASGTTVSIDSANGQRTLNVVSATGFAAGDIIAIQDSGGGVTRLEWARVSKKNPANLILDRDLQFTHTAVQADTVHNEADTFAPIWLSISAGGALWEIIFDYGDDLVGDSVVVEAKAQTYDSDQTIT